MTGLSRINRERLRDESHRWVFDGKSDFEKWCDSAGLEPEYVRKKAKDIYENGYTFRADPGKGARYKERQAYRLKVALRNGR